MALTSNSLSIESIEIASLRSIARNVRRHTPGQLLKIQKSLNHFGHVRPILVTPDLDIIDGHLICEALKANGATKVLVIVVRALSPAEIRALRLMLHRSPEDAVWDSAAVRIELQTIMDAGLDLDLTGFDTPELDWILSSDIPQANVSEDRSEIPRARTTAISKPDDIWQCGKHRIGCGNACDRDFVARVRNDRAANVCFADPPSNGFVSGKGQHQHRELLQGSGEISSNDLFALLRDSLEVLRTASTADALIYVCMDWRHLVELAVAGRTCGMALDDVCVWVKNNAGVRGIYRNQHEMVWVFRAGADQPFSNLKPGKRNRSNVWSYPSTASFGDDRDDLLASHAIVKPIAMISDVLRDVTKRGDVVLDTFLGSGSTLMAAQETGRVCLGVELDPLCVDVAIRRWQRATGLEAVPAESGQTFEQSARQMLALPTGSSS